MKLQKDKIMTEGPQEVYRIPQVFEAWRVTEDDLPNIARWCKGKVKGYSITFPRIRDKSKPLDSQERNSYAVCGDVIVKSSKGFTVLKGETFEREFRPATSRVGTAN